MSSMQTQQNELITLERKSKRIIITMVRGRKDLKRVVKEVLQCNHPNFEYSKYSECMSKIEQWHDDVSGISDHTNKIFDALKTILFIKMFFCAVDPFGGQQGSMVSQTLERESRSVCCPTVYWKPERWDKLINYVCRLVILISDIEELETTTCSEWTIKFLDLFLKFSLFHRKLANMRVDLELSSVKKIEALTPPEKEKIIPDSLSASLNKTNAKFQYIETRAASKVCEVYSRTIQPLLTTGNIEALRVTLRTQQHASLTNTQNLVNKFLKDSFDVFFGEKQETEPHELKGVGPSFVFDCNEDQDFVNDVWQMPKPVVCQSTRKRKRFSKVEHDATAKAQAMFGEESKWTDKCNCVKDVLDPSRTPGSVKDHVRNHYNKPEFVRSVEQHKLNLAIQFDDNSSDDDCF